MTPDLMEFLSDLNTRGIKIWRENEQLRVSAPKGAITPVLQQQIVAWKSEILLFLSEAQIEDEIGLEAIKPAARADALPLSMTQLDIWPMIEQNPGSSAYQMVNAQRSFMDLDLAIMEKALTEVTRRHEILRSTFTIRDGQPVQVVCPPGDFPIEYQDMRDIPAEQRENRVLDQMAVEAARPLDPAQGPLFRLLVYQLGERDFVIMEVLHFLVSDCIGEAIIQEEVARLYDAFSRGEPSPLPPVPVQYADFAIWEHNQRAKGSFNGQLEYWRRTLAAPRPPRMTLAGQPLDSAHSSRPIRRYILLPESLTAEINALAHRQKGTLYMVLLAGYSLFLRAHSGQQDLLIGTPMAGRIYPGLERSVGRFLNTLALRIKMADDQDFLALLARARQTAMDALANQDVPFVQVVEALRADAGEAAPQEPLFSVQLNFAPLSDKAPAGDQPSNSKGPDLEQSDARYPLTLYISLSGETIKFMFIAQEELFAAAQLDIFLQQLQTIFQRIVDNPNLPTATYTEDITNNQPVIRAAAADEAALTGQETAQAEEPSADPLTFNLVLPDQLTIEADPVEEGTAERTRVIEQALVGIWKRLLKTNTITAQDDFFALGGSSLLALKMAHDVHEAFGVNIPLNLVFRYPRIESIARILQKQIGRQPWDSLVEIQPNGSRPPIYFVHGITGDTLWFELFAKYLDSEQPIYGLQARGLDGLQPPHETVEEMAQLYVQEIRRHQPTGPYYIAGYSSGGNTAYEIACQLRESGQEVGLLVVIDQANPRSNYHTVRLGPSLVVNILRNLPYRVIDVMRLNPTRIFKRVGIKLQKSLLDIQWAMKNREHGARSYKVDELVDYAPSLPDHIQKIIQLGYAALLKYNPRPYAGRLTLIRAKGGRLLCSHDPQMGWGSHAKAVDVRVIPGAHWSMFQEPYIRSLSAAIQACLDEAQKTG